MADYSREQIYEAMRRADAAGDGEAVKALAAALKGGATKPQILDIAKQNNLSVNEADLDANIASRDRGGPVNKFVQPERATLADGIQNAVAGAAQGVVAGTYDLGVEVGKLPTYAFNAVTRGGANVLDGMGLDGPANFLRRGVDRYERDMERIPSVADVIEQVSPTPEGMGGARLASQLVGSVFVPFGPKGVPKTTLPKAGSVFEADEVIQAGKDAGVRVLTSDVKPPRGFVGKSVRAIGERIPFAGTGSTRIKQNEERIEAVKTLAKDFGVEGGTELLDEVSRDLAKTRGAKLTTLSQRKNKIIDGLSAPRSPDEVANVSNAVVSDISSSVKSNSVQASVPPLRPHEGSWFVVDRETGKGVSEIFKPDAAIAAKVDGAKFELVPAGDYLGRLNSLIKEAGGRDPSPEAMKVAFGSKASRSSPESVSAPVSSPPAAPLARTAPIVSAPKAVAEIDRQLSLLKRMNNDTVEPVIRKLEDFKNTLTSGLDLRNVEENRKLLGEAFSDPSLASIKSIGQKAVNAIYAPLRDDMGTFIKAEGGDKAFAAWKGANDELAAMAGELDAGTFKRVLQNTETTPENVASLLFSKKPSDVRRLYANLSSKGQQKAKAAVLHEAITKAGGLDDISPQRFANSLKAFGRTTGIIFGDDAPRIEGIVRLLRATQQASVAAAAPPTGVQNALPIGGAVLADWAGSLGGATATATTAGLAARLYESAPVRDLLVRLSRTAPGSKAEGKMIERIGKVIISQTEIQSGNFTRAANANSVGRLAAEDREAVN